MIDKQDLKEVKLFLECLAGGHKGAIQKDEKGLKAKEHNELFERLLMVVDIKMQVAELVKDEVEE